jgi:hypothetical protein
MVEVVGSDSYPLLEVPMLTGFYVLKGTGAPKYTPTFPRGGLAANFAVQVLDLVGSPTDLVAVVEHKNIEDTAFIVAGTFPVINSINVFNANVSGIKEEVRFSFAPTAANAWEGFYLLLPAPAWRPY